MAERPVTGPSLAAGDGRLLRQVLAGLRYPARWWEILALADMYGIAAFQRAELARLPQELYADLDHILHALTNPDRPRPGADPPRRARRVVRPATVGRPPGERHGSSGWR